MNEFSSSEFGIFNHMMFPGARPLTGSSVESPPFRTRKVN